MDQNDIKKKIKLNQENAAKSLFDLRKLFYDMNTKGFKSEITDKSPQELQFYMTHPNLSDFFIRIHID